MRGSFISYQIYAFKAYILKYVLNNLSEYNWKNAVQAVRFYKKQFMGDKNQVEKITQHIKDVNRTFLLYCCSMVNF